MNSAVKKHDSCVRVLEFLKILIQDDVNLNEIFEKNNEKFKDIEATETLLKYIATLDISGLKIQKIDKKYSLDSFINTMTLEEKEIKILSKILASFDNCCLENQRKDFENLTKNILKSLNTNTRTKLIKSINNQKILNTNNLSEIAENFNQYIKTAQQIKISYENKTFIGEPKNVEIKNNKIYLSVYLPHDARNKKLLTDKIQNIEILPSKINSLNITETVVFAVYDGLSTNYRLRENEHIQNFSSDCKIIVNCGEDRDILIKRLLKYGENCKIITPTSFKEEFIQKLNQIADKLEGVKI